MAMRANSHANARKASNSSVLQGQIQYTFNNHNYLFPNDPELSRKCKSFVTLLEIPHYQLSEAHNKKLSMINRCHFVIKLKQIKPEEEFQEEGGAYRYLLYYEAVPYSLAYVKASQMASSLAALKLEKALKEVVGDLVQFNIFTELTIEHCGFTEQGEFRVYVPPLYVLNDRKLTLTDKQRMNAAAASIFKYWQAQRIQAVENSNGHSTTRLSYRFNSPQNKKETIVPQAQPQPQKSHRLSQQNTDIKKTIKLSKNYIRQLNDKGQEEKQHELKKHRSLEMLLKMQERPQQPKTGSHFLSKIDELSKKLTNIREALINKKSTDHPRQALENFISREKQRSKKSLNNYINPVKNQQQHYTQEIIFQKKDQARQEKLLPLRNNKPKMQDRYEDDRQSVDTYLQQIGNQYKMPKFAPSNELRNTTLPTELQIIKNALQGKEKQKSNWHHESAGNVAFKRFIQKSRDIYPELSNDRSPTSLSKISAPEDRKSKGFKKDNSQQKLKKMCSLDTFQMHAQTKSINLSEFSNELSNAKRRRQKEQRNRVMKDKIQDILMKSKKAIELLKNPIKIKK